LPEWFSLVAARGERMADEALVDVLDLGKRRSDLRPAILSVLGRRGRWLAGRNGDWGYVGGEAEHGDPETAWQTGKKTERLVALRGLRANDPDRARALLGSTFSTEPPDDRAAFLEAFETGLGPGDEPFLEAALDDRAKSVRRVAADLLGRLPGSALCQRMIGRATPLVAWEGPKRPGHGRLKLGAALPEACPPDWVRDGIEPKLTPLAKDLKLGERAWWLAQLLAAVPPAHWSSTSSQTPEALIEAAAGGEWADAIGFGWAHAAASHQDPEWSSALLRHRHKEARRVDGLAARLMAPLPADRREALLLEHLRADSGPFQAEHPTIWLLQFVDGPIGVELARALLDWLRTVVPQEGDRRVAARSVQGCWLLCHHLGPRLPVVLAEEVRGSWGGDLDNPSLSHSIGQMIDCLEFRREMHEEFRP
jgi:hypothetical protein